MRLRIVTPLQIVADEDFTSLRAEDASGAFGIMAQHAAFLTTLPWQVAVPLFFAGGFLLGFGYFSALRRTTAMMLHQGSMLLVLALTLGRMAAIAAGFYLAALVGWQALLAAFAGAMLGRALILRKRQATP